jgi:hypothetical protein
MEIFLKIFIEKFSKIFNGIFSVLQETINQLSQLPIVSDPLTISILTGVVVISSIVLVIVSKRKKISQISNAQNPKIKPLSPEDKAYTQQFKNSVAGLDLDLNTNNIANEKNPDKKITAKEKKELNLDLKALKELLDREYISQIQFDIKAMELKKTYGQE